MGGFITVEIQSKYNLHDALVLLGSGFSGHQAMLSEEEKQFAFQSQTVIRSHAVELLKKRHGQPLPRVHNELFEQALIEGVRTRLLGSIGLLTMIPGSIDDELPNIRVPIYLAVGDRDLGGKPHEIPVKLSSSSDISLMVYPDTGHNHFAFDSVALQFRHLDNWLSMQKPSV